MIILTHWKQNNSAQCVINLIGIVLDVWAGNIGNMALAVTATYLNM